MTEMEEFLARQKFYRCEPLSANLTVTQCEANRKRQTNYITGSVAVLSCQGCAGLGKAVELKERIEMAKQGTCKHCNKDGDIHGRGLCQGCYNTLKKAGTLDDLYPMVGRNPHEFGVKRGAKKPDISVPVEMIAGSEPNLPIKPVPTPTLEAIVEHSRSAASLMPVITAPDTLRLSPGMISRIEDLKINHTDLLDVLDAFLHGELERHPYRRVA